MSGSDSELVSVKAERNGILRKETEKEREERHHHQAMLAALNDDRVTDMESLRAAVRAHRKRNEEDERLLAKGLEPELGQNATCDERADGDNGKVTLTDMTDPALAASVSASDKNALAELRTTKPQAADQQKSQGQNKAAAPKRWATGHGREYPIPTERASAVARWVIEAPFVASDGARKRKKKPANKAGVPAPTAGSDEVAAGT
jgi:hypothetical protein